MIIAAVVAVVAAGVLLAWAGIEVDHVIHAYPGQFWMGIFGLLFIMVGMAARVRAAHRPVRLRPAGPQVPPLPKALQAVPVLTAIAGPAIEDTAPGCEGPGCPNKIDDDPWRAQLPGGEEHRFCSRACAEGWHDARRSGASRP